MTSQKTISFRSYAKTRGVEGFYAWVAQAVKVSTENGGLRVGNIENDRNETVYTAQCLTTIKAALQWFGIGDIFVGYRTSSLDAYALVAINSVVKVVRMEFKCWSPEKVHAYVFEHLQQVGDVQLRAFEQCPVEFDKASTWLKSRYDLDILNVWCTIAYDGTNIEYQFEDQSVSTKVVGEKEPVKLADVLIKAFVGTKCERSTSVEAIAEINVFDSVMSINDDCADHAFKLGMTGKLGQNFTPAKVALRLVKRALPKVKELYDKAEYSKLVQYIKSLKVFDPTCGEGAILIAAYVYLNTYLKAACEKLGIAVVAVRPSQFYGIEIDRYYAHRCQTWFAEHDSSEDACIKCANSLAEDWLDFTGGTDDVVVISNFPFERDEELQKSELGLETLKLWKGCGCKKSAKSTCDCAFFHKCIVYGYNFYAIGANSTCNYVEVKPVDTYMWTGNAEFLVSEYVKGRVDRLVNIYVKKSLTNAFVAKQINNGNIPEGSYKLGRTFDSFEPVPAGYTTGGQYLVSPTAWSIKARMSKAFKVWLSNVCTNYAFGTEPGLNVGVCHTFPLFQGDDLTHYDTMTDEEIFQELLAKYNALVSKAS